MYCAQSYTSPAGSSNIGAEPIHSPSSSPPCLQETVSSEAKADPARLFEGEDWVEWLPGPSMADCKQGVRLAVDFVVGEGVFHPDPGSRPQDVEAARELLTKAVALYEQERQREIELEQGDGATGATRRESGAGG